MLLTIITTALSVIGALGVISILPWIKIDIDFLAQRTPGNFKFSGVKILARASNSGMMPIKGYLMFERGSEKIKSQVVRIQDEEFDGVEFTFRKNDHKEQKINRESAMTMAIGYMRIITEQDDMYASRIFSGKMPQNIESHTLNDFDNFVKITFVPVGLYGIVPKFFRTKKINFRDEILEAGVDKIVTSGINPEWAERNYKKTSTLSKNLRFITKDKIDEIVALAVNWETFIGLLNLCKADFETKDNHDTVRISVVVKEEDEVSGHPIFSERHIDYRREEVIKKIGTRFSAPPN